MDIKKYSLLTILIIALTAACGPKEEAPDAAAVAAEQQALAEQQAKAAARQSEQEALGARLSSISSSVSELARNAGSGSYPTGLETAIAEIENKIGGPDRLLNELENAGDADWDAASDRLAEALDKLESEAKATAQKASAWGQQEQSALDARADLELPIDPESGLLEGLDDGLYDQYLVSVVERVQQELRARGLYAGPADGYFDITTREAVGRFQEQEEIPVSGVPSPVTRERLFADASGG